VLTEDAFRKSYDRYLQFQSNKILRFLEKSPDSSVRVCTTGLNYFYRTKAHSVQPQTLAPCHDPA
jgi:hypothetical protein